MPGPPGGSSLQEGLSGWVEGGCDRCVLRAGGGGGQGQPGVRLPLAPALGLQEGDRSKGVWHFPYTHTTASQNHTALDPNAEGKPPALLPRGLWAPSSVQLPRLPGWEGRWLSQWLQTSRSAGAWCWQGPHIPHSHPAGAEQLLELAATTACQALPHSRQRSLFPWLVGEIPGGGGPLIPNWTRNGKDSFPSPSSPEQAPCPGVGGGRR